MGSRAGRSTLPREINDIVATALSCLLADQTWSLIWSLSGLSCVGKDREERPAMSFVPECHLGNLNHGPVSQRLQPEPGHRSQNNRTMGEEVTVKQADICRAGLGEDVLLNEIGRIGTAPDRMESIFSSYETKHIMYRVASPGTSLEADRDVAFGGTLRFGARKKVPLEEGRESIRAPGRGHFKVRKSLWKWTYARARARD